MLPLCYARLVREPGQGSLPMCFASLKSSGFQVGRAAITRLLKKASDLVALPPGWLKGSSRQRGPFLYGMTIGLSDKQDNPQRHGPVPLRLPFEASFRWHGFETILTHKRASRTTPSHLSGKSHVGLRHLCRKAPRTLAGGINQGAVPLDRSNLRLLLSRQHHPLQIQGL